MEEKKDCNKIFHELSTYVTKLLRKTSKGKNYCMECAFLKAS